MGGLLSIKSKFQNIWILLACSLIFFVANVDTTIVNVALPTMAITFNTDLLIMNDVIIYFLVAFAISIPLVEFTIDRLGLKTTLILSCILFASSSLLCAISSNFSQLVIFRFIQGIGAGFFVPIVRSVVAGISDEKSLSINLSNVQSLGMFGQAIGPFVGGIILSSMDWRYIFYLNIPLCLVVLFFVICCFDSQRFNNKIKYKFDFKGYALTVCGVITLFFVLNSFKEGAYHEIYLLAKIVVVLLAFYLLRRHILKYRGKQILNFSLLSSNNMLKNSLIISLIVRQYTGIMQFFIIVFFHQFYHESITLGYICLSYGLGLWCSKLLAKYLFVRFEVIKIMRSSLLTVFSLNVTLFGLLSNFHPFLIVIIFMFVIGIAISLLHSSLNIYSFGLTNKKDLVSVSSLVSMVMYISGASSIAIFSILSSLINTINIAGKNQYLIAEFILSMVLIYAFAIIPRSTLNQTRK